MRSRLLETGAIARVQSWDSEARAPAAAEALLGVVWPHATGAVTSGRAGVICVGPTDWLLIEVAGDDSSWLQRLDSTFAGSTFRLTDVSQSLTRIEISGPEVRDLLAKACALDLHLSRFAPGRSAPTRFAGMPVVVRCIDDSTFECIITQSYLGYLLSWLADATLEFHPGTMNAH